MSPLSPILKEGGPAALLQACALLLLRLLDLQEAEREAVALFNREDYRHRLPPAARWTHLAGLRGSDLRIALMEAALLSQTAKGGLPVDLHHPALLDALALHPFTDDLLAVIDALPFETHADQRAAADLLAAGLDETGDRDLAQLRTPPALAALLVTLADPRLGERIYDPCFGAAEVLVRCARRMLDGEEPFSPAQWRHVQQDALFGVEINNQAHLIGLTRLLLSGITRPGLALGDALARPLERGADQLFDCVIANPPWGWHYRGDEEWFSREFPVRARSGEGLFLQHALAALRLGGRAILALPTGMLSRSGRDAELRGWLLDTYQVEAVIQLPPRATLPLSAISASILVVRRLPPSQPTRFLTLEEGFDPAAVPARLEADGTKVTREAMREREDVIAVPPAAEVDLSRLLEELTPLAPARRLDAVAELQPGAAYNRMSRAEEDGGPIALVRVQDVGEHTVRPPTMRITRAQLRHPRLEQLLRSGDVVLTTSGSIGRAALATKGSVGAVASNGVTLLRPKDDLSPHFLAAILRSPPYRAYLDARATGVGILHLNLKALRQVLIPIPSLQVQVRALKQMEGKGGDILSILRGFLVETADPLAVFFASHPIVDTVLRAPKGADPASLIQQVRLGLAEAIGFQRDLPPPKDPLSKEIWMVLYLLQPLDLDVRRSRDVTALQAGSLGFAIDRLPRVREATNQPRALNFFGELGDLFHALRVQLADQVHIDARDTGESNLGALEIVNEGPAPLVQARFVIKAPGQPLITEHDSLFAAGDTLKVEVGPAGEPSLRDPVSELDFYDVDVEWSGLTVDGRPLSGSTSVLVSVAWPLKDDESEEEAPPPELGHSPYVTGTFIQRQEMFFGRNDIIQKIRIQLHPEREANILLLEGSRRIGKSSVLHRLKLPGVLPEGWLPIHHTFQRGIGGDGQVGLPTEEIFRRIGHTLIKECWRAGFRIAADLLGEQRTPTPRPSDIDDRLFSAGNVFDALEGLLEEAIDALAPRRLLLMLDEFDKIQEGIASGVTSPQVPGNLRYLFQSHPQVGGILAGATQMRRMREQYLSALFGLGYTIPLGPLAREDARTLVIKPVEGRLSYTPSAVDKVVDVCACQPLLVQMLCNQIFEWAALHGARHITPQHVEDAIQEMVANNVHLSTTLWKTELRTERQRYLLWLIDALHSGPDPVTIALLEMKLDEAGVPRRDDDPIGPDLELLRDLDLVVMEHRPSGSVYRLSLPLMSLWMRKHHDPHELRRRAVQQGQEHL